MNQWILLPLGVLLGGVAIAADDAALAQCAAVDDPTARLACYDTLAGRPASAQVPAVPVTPRAATPADTFGLTAPPSTKENLELKTRITGPFKMWEKGTRVPLENGQVWRVIGEGRFTYPGVPDNAEVTVAQSSFGGFWMEIHAISRKVRVKRIS